MILSVNLAAQLININPDPNGPPWIVGDAIPTPPEISATIPLMVLTSVSDSTTLDYIVDNSELIYMPPVFDQGFDGSCVRVVYYGHGDKKLKQRKRIKYKTLIERKKQYQKNQLILC